MSLPTSSLVAYVFVVAHEDSDCFEQNTGGGMRGSLQLWKNMQLIHTSLSNSAQHHRKTY